MYLISPELPEDAGAIDYILDQAFGAARRRKAVYRLRDGVPPIASLGFVMRAEGSLKATIRFWPVLIGAELPALLLGPIAVLPSERGRGLGVTLMTHALAEARRQGHRRVLLVGDLGYYARFGFSPATKRGIRLWGGVDDDRLLGLALRPGAFDGVSGAIGKGPCVDVA